MTAYPAEFRHRVVELHSQGWTTQEIRQASGASRAWVDSVTRLHAARKPLDIESSAHRRTSRAERQGERLKARVAEHPGTTLAELEHDLGLAESTWATWKALRALGLWLKRSRSGPPSGIARTSSGGAPSGRSSAPGSIRAASPSSTRRSAPRR